MHSHLDGSVGFHCGVHVVRLQGKGRRNTHGRRRDRDVPDRNGRPQRLTASASRITPKECGTFFAPRPGGVKGLRRYPRWDTHCRDHAVESQAGLLAGPYGRTIATQARPLSRVEGRVQEETANKRGFASQSRRPWDASYVPTNAAPNPRAPRTRYGIK